MNHVEERIHDIAGKRGYRVIEITMRFRAEDLPRMSGTRRSQFVIDMLREQPALAVDAADKVDVRWLP